MIPIEVKAIAILVLILGIAAGVWRAYDWAYDKGVQADTLLWQQRELSQAQQVAATIKQKEDDARAKEAANAQAMASANDNFEKGLQNVQHKNDLVIAQLRDGTRRMRDPGHVDSPASCDGGSTQVAASTGGSDGAAGSQFSGSNSGFLSTEASGFLVKIGARADKTAIQLAACQQIIVDDRKLCGEVGKPIQ